MKRTFDTATLALLVMPPLFWAGNAVVGRAAVATFPPLALSFWRWVLAFALIAPFAAAGVWRHRQLIRAHFGVLFWTSLLGVACYNSLQYLALQTSPAINTTLIGASSPIMALLLGAAFFGTVIGRRQMLGALLSLAGVLWVVSGGDLSRLLSLGLASGDVIMLVATLAWAIYTWLIRVRRPPLPLTVFLAVQIGVGAVLILPFYLLELALLARWPEPTAGNLLALLYVATLPSLVAYYCWDRGVVRAGAVVPMYFVNLTPVFAGALGWFVLSEPIGWHHLVGGLLILTGIHMASASRR